MTHIYLSSPVHHAPELEFVECLMVLPFALRDAGISYSVEMPHGESLITRARNNAVARFLASPATHLLFIDSDQTFAPPDVIALVRAEKPIVGTLIPKKQINWDSVRTAATTGIDDIEGYGAQYVVNPSTAGPAALEGECAPVDAVGTGFMLVERRVIEDMIASMPEIAYLTDDVVGERHPRWAVFDVAVDQESRRYLSEDYEFCRRARKLGYQPYVHLGVRDIGHVGKHRYRGCIESAFVRHGAAEAAE